MRRREASINDVPIREQDRRFFWPAPAHVLRTIPASQIFDYPDNDHWAWNDHAAIDYYVTVSCDEALAKFGRHSAAGLEWTHGLSDRLLPK